MDILVTNNPLVVAEFQGTFQVDFPDTDLLGILIRVRDHIHKGHRLLTHPLSGSVKPNETLYKSVLISAAADETDMHSVMTIEECIQAVQKFASKSVPEQYLNDMQVVDLSLIRAALGK